MCPATKTLLCKLCLSCQYRSNAIVTKWEMPWSLKYSNKYFQYVILLYSVSYRVQPLQCLVWTCVWGSGRLLISWLPGKSSYTSARQGNCFVTVKTKLSFQWETVIQLSFETQVVTIETSMTSLQLVWPFSMDCLIRFSL